MLKIRQLREERNIQQSELAEYLGIAQPVLSRYEYGIKVPSLSLAISMADYFDISLDELVGRNLAKENKNADDSERN